MKYSVVVAEDEPLILDSIVRHINTSELGFEVVGTANNGQKAWDMTQRYTPHVLFSDVQMPLMSGLELFEKTYEDYPNIFKVIISGYAEFEYARQAMMYQAQDYILKPVIHEDIVRVLKKIRAKLNSQQQLIAERLEKQGKAEYGADEAAVIMENYIKEHYMEDINMELLAASLHFNLSYLGRIFSKMTGKSPSKYLTSIRINKARQLLKYNSELSIQEIGILCGYPNQAYFSRIFKNVTGESPIKIRKSEADEIYRYIQDEEKSQNNQI